MGSSYQTVLACGDLAGVRAAVAESGQQAVIMPVGQDRWAVVPAREDGAYAETEELARLASRPAGAWAAAFDVFDSSALVIHVFRGGLGHHEYLSDQSCYVEDWDDDDNEIWYDLLGRPYPAESDLPTGAYGADPAAFAPLGLDPVDEAALRSALGDPGQRAEEQHRAILAALNLHSCPLTMHHEDALASGLGV